MAFFDDIKSGVKGALGKVRDVGEEIFSGRGGQLFGTVQEELGLTREETFDRTQSGLSGSVLGATSGATGQQLQESQQQRQQQDQGGDALRMELVPGAKERLFGDDGQQEDEIRVRPPATSGGGPGTAGSTTPVAPDPDPVAPSPDRGRPPSLDPTPEQRDRPDRRRNEPRPDIQITGPGGVSGGEVGGFGGGARGVTPDFLGQQGFNIDVAPDAPAQRGTPGFQDAFRRTATESGLLSGGAGQDFRIFTQQSPTGQTGQRGFGGSNFTGTLQGVGGVGLPFVPQQEDDEERRRRTLERNQNLMRPGRITPSGQVVLDEAPGAPPIAQDRVDLTEGTAEPSPQVDGSVPSDSVERARQSPTSFEDLFQRARDINQGLIEDRTIDVQDLNALMEEFNNLASQDNSGLSQAEQEAVVASQIQAETGVDRGRAEEIAGGLSSQQFDKRLRDAGIDVGLSEEQRKKFNRVVEGVRENIRRQADRQDQTPDEPMITPDSVTSNFDAQQEIENRLEDFEAQQRALGIPGDISRLNEINKEIASIRSAQREFVNQLQSNPEMPVGLANRRIRDMNDEFATQLQTLQNQAANIQESLSLKRDQLRRRMGIVEDVREEERSRRESARQRQIQNFVVNAASQGASAQQIFQQLGGQVDFGTVQQLVQSVQQSQQQPERFELRSVGGNVIQIERDPQTGEVIGQSVVAGGGGAGGGGINVGTQQMQNIFNSAVNEGVNNLTGILERFRDENIPQEQAVSFIDSTDAVDITLSNLRNEAERVYGQGQSQGREQIVFQSAKNQKEGGFSRDAAKDRLAVDLGGKLGVDVDSFGELEDLNPDFAQLIDDAVWLVYTPESDKKKGSFLGFGGQTREEIKRKFGVESSEFQASGSVDLTE